LRCFLFSHILFVTALGRLVKTGDGGRARALS